MKLCFATNNLNKIHEVKALLGTKFEILSLQQIGFNDELAEDHDTLEENSFQKAQFIFDHYQVNCFADDSGLEVYALNFLPGARSARYAGNQRNDKDNIRLLLHHLTHESDRRARFRTVISLILEGKTFQFEGIVEGKIINEERGISGFGYDPIFIPDGYDKTFAEMSMTDKNSISHRGKAIRKLIEFLQNY